MLAESAILAEHLIGGNLTSPSVLWRRRGRFTLILRSASWTQPACDPWYRISPLVLPGVLAPATCSALNTRICSSIWWPISWITCSTTWLAFWIRLTMGSRICPLAWQNCSMMAALSRVARVTIWYGFFTAVGSFRRFLFGNRILSNRRQPPPTNLQLNSGRLRVDFQDGL